MSHLCSTKSNNILVIADLEGAIGVDSIEDLKACIENRLNELLALYDVLGEALGYNLFYGDCHDGMLEDRIPKTCVNLKYCRSLWEIDFSIRYDCAILLGFHAKNNTMGFLAHSFRPEIEEFFISDRKTGEIQFFVNLLAYYFIPTVLICGDIGAVEDCKEITCAKHSVKGLDGKNKKEMFDVMKDFKKVLYESVLNGERYLTNYDSCPIKICFKSTIYSRVLGQCGFKLNNDNEIVIDSTLECFRKFPLIGVALNVFRIQRRADNVDNLRKALLKQLDYYNLDHGDRMTIEQCLLQDKQHINTPSVGHFLGGRYEG